MNKKNLKLFIECYMNRMDITGKLKSDLTCDALLVVGSKSSQSSAAEYMHSHMDKVKFNYKVILKKYSFIFSVVENLKYVWKKNFQPHVVNGILALIDMTPSFP